MRTDSRTATGAPTRSRKAVRLVKYLVPTYVLWHVCRDWLAFTVEDFSATISGLAQ